MKYATFFNNYCTREGVFVNYSTNRNNIFTYNPLFLPPSFVHPTPYTVHCTPEKAHENAHFLILRNDY